MCSSNPDISEIPNTKSTDEEESSSSQETEIKITAEKDQEMQPHENDILMGRGGKNNQHVGNEKLRGFARLESKNYRMASKNGKSCISRNLVSQVRGMSPTGRFLKKNNATGAWEDVGDDVAREKTSQVLRDAVAILIQPPSNKISDTKVDRNVDINSSDVIPCSRSVTPVTQSAKRRYWEDFTCSEPLQHIVPNSVYHPYTLPSNYELSSKRPRYDVITCDERSSHWTHYHLPIRYSIPVDHISYHPVSPRMYIQTPLPRHHSPTVSRGSVQKYTTNDEFDLFNGEILNSDGEEDDDDDNSNDVVDVFDFDQSQKSEGITAKIWPVCV